MRTTTNTMPTPLSGSETSSVRDTSRLDTLTNETCNGSSLPTSPITLDAISLPESPDGNSPLLYRDGQQTDLFGQPLSLASRSALPEKKKAVTTTVTFGRCFTASSESIALQ